MEISGELRRGISSLESAMRNKEFEAAFDHVLEALKKIADALSYLQRGMVLGY